MIFWGLIQDDSAISQFVCLYTTLTAGKKKSYSLFLKRDKFSYFNMMQGRLMKRLKWNWNYSQQKDIFWELYRILKIVLWRYYILEVVPLVKYSSCQIFLYHVWNLYQTIHVVVWGQWYIPNNHKNGCIRLDQKNVYLHVLCEQEITGEDCNGKADVYWCCSYTVPVFLNCDWDSWVKWCLQPGAVSPEWELVITVVA